MPTFGEHELVSMEEAAIAMGPDVLTVCSTVVDRVDLVAQNFAVAMPQMREDLLAAQMDDYPARWMQARLRAEATSMEKLREDLPDTLMAGQPLEAAFQGLKMFTFMMRAHTPHIPEIFRGYTPIYPSPEWSKKLHEREYAKYGYYEEPLIGYALAVGRVGERYRSYGQLFIDAMRYGQLPLSSPYLHRLPLLN